MNLIIGDFIMALSKHLTDTSLYTWAMLRIGLGAIFLWAFLDKLFGLGFATCRDAVTDVVSVGCSAAWLYGGSPTEGFLQFATKGPFADFYQSLAGLAWVDWLFMLGLAGIGTGLLLGIAVRLVAVAGIMLMLLMWSSLLWPSNNPVIDEHVIYALVLAGIFVTAQHQKWSLRRHWLKLDIVQRLRFLQ